LRSLVEAVPRQRDPVRRPAPAELHGLTPETTVLLRELAERSLHALGVAPTEARITDEMHRYLAVIVAILPPGPEMENELQGAIRAAILEFDLRSTESDVSAMRYLIRQRRLSTLP